MSEPGFQIANRDWAKREFPKRLLEVAMKRHNYSPGDTFGINQDIATACGVDKSMVTQWLRKGSLPRAATVFRIAEAYGVSPDWLVGNDSVPEGGYSLEEVGNRLPLPAIYNVMRIMYEAQQDMEQKPTREVFARASVEVLKLVADDPSMPEHAIYGAAVYGLKHGSIDATANADEH